MSDLRPGMSIAPSDTTGDPWLDGLRRRVNEDRRVKGLPPLPPLPRRGQDWMDARGVIVQRAVRQREMEQVATDRARRVAEAIESDPATRFDDDDADFVKRR